MAERLNEDEILARNPGVDREKLEGIAEGLRRVREEGLRPKGYDLAPPFGGRRASIQDDARVNVRVVRTRRSE